MSNSQRGWTDAEETLLRSLVKENRTAGQIAKAFGSRRSRNSIIGKVGRLGLKLQSGEVSGSARLTPASYLARREATSPFPKSSKPLTKTKSGPRADSAGINPQRIPDFKPPTIIPDRAGSGPTVAELETGMCRAPVGAESGADQQHCGGQTDPVPKGSRSGIGGFETYCPSCARRLQKPTPSRAR